MREVRERSIGRREEVVKKEVAAIFAGSFDPPHVGHLLIIKEVLRLGKADLVLVAPAVSHPFGKLLATFEDRLEMCRLMIEGERLQGAWVSDVEKRRRLGGRTIETIEALACENPSRELRLIVGSDILDEKERWHRFDEIERLAPLIVVAREGSRVPPGGEAIPPVSAVSSTEVRRRIGAGMDCSGMVTPPVLRYIAMKGLYGKMIC